jgi:hypothetical protein
MAGLRDALFSDDVVTSYRDLRRGIGILGLSLPFALVIGHEGLAPSISAYYYTDMRNWLVGTLWAIGFFLIFYRYGRPDTLLSSIAGILAILVALLPTTPDVPHPPTHQVVIGHCTWSSPPRSCSCSPGSACSSSPAPASALTP